MQQVGNLILQDRHKLDLNRKTPTSVRFGSLIPPVLASTWGHLLTRCISAWGRSSRCCMPWSHIPHSCACPRSGTWRFSPFGTTRCFIPTTIWWSGTLYSIPVGLLLLCWWCFISCLIPASSLLCLSCGITWTIGNRLQGPIFCFSPDLLMQGILKDQNNIKTCSMEHLSKLLHTWLYKWFK